MLELQQPFSDYGSLSIIFQQVILDFIIDRLVIENAIFVQLLECPYHFLRATLVDKDKIDNRFRTNLKFLISIQQLLQGDGLK